MADAIVRLRVESSEYDQKLSRATQQLQHMEKEVRRTGATFAYADKEEIAFIQSLGSMETKTTSAKSQLREYTEALMQMTSTYRNLTQEEKNSDWGKALAASMDEIKGKAAMLRDAMSDVNREIGGMASDTQVFDQIAGGVTGLVSVFQVGQGAMQMFGVKSNDAVQAIAKLQGAMAVANGLTKVQAMLQKESAVMIGIATVQKKAAAAAEAIDTAAKEKNIAVTKGAAIAQKALNAVANANPFVLLASAIGAVVAALSIFSRSANKAADDQKKFAQSVGSSMGEMVSSYTLLKNQWEQLTTEQEKNDWIKNNASEFSKLGVAINDVADAEKVFKDETAAMVKSFELRAKAAALQSLAEENYKKYYEKAAGKETYKGMELSQQDAAKIVFANGYSMDGLFEGEKDGKFILSEQGAELYNKTMFGDGKEKADAYAQSIQDVNKELDDLYKNNGLKTAEDTNKNDKQNDLTPLEQREKKIKEVTTSIEYMQSVLASEADAETKAWATDQLKKYQSELDNLNGKKQEQQKQDQKQLSLAEQRAERIKEVNGAIRELNNILETSEDENQKAWATQQLKKYQDEIDNLNGKLKETKVEIQELNPNMSGPDMSAFEKMQQSIRIKLAEENFEVDQNALTNLMTFAIQKGITGMDGAFEGLQYMLSEGLDIKDSDIQAVVDKINEQLANMGLEPIKINFETGGLEEVKTEVISATEAMKESLDKMQSGVSAISTIGNAFNDLKGIGEDLANAFSGDMDTWDALMTVFNSGISIMQTVMGVMEAINTLTELSSALKKANTVATETEAATALTSAATEAGAEATKAGANMTTAGTAAAASSAEAGEAVAGIPIVGPILAVAAIAAVLAATFAAMSKAKSAGKFASGGIVPGNNHNDGLIANVSSGELILNRSQQDSIANQLTNSNPLGNLALSMNLKGEDIQICLDNNRMRRGR